MGFAFIREGDTTSHGGRVLACDPANMDCGRPIALLGDKVSCPRCGGVFPIVGVKNELNMSFDGRPVATEGDKTACGATLIASQSDSTASPTAGAGSSVGGGRSVLAAASDASSATPHRGRFQVLDDETGRPVPNHPYTVTGDEGQKIAGRTDENGYTEWLDTVSASSITFEHRGTDAA
jgi:uncharacterized Zn-binding protein involved in type VI secretion